jgi:hypothetical protein
MCIIIAVFMYVVLIVTPEDKDRLTYVVCFLLGFSPAYEVYMPTFWNTLSHLHRRVGMKNNRG